MLQHGAYTLLMDACYDRERFPTEAEAIEWCWASTVEEESAIRFVLARFFTLEDGLYVQKTIAENLADYAQKAAINKAIATDREAKRAERKRTVNEAPPIVDEPPPNHKPLTTNHKPVTSVGGVKRRKQIPAEFYPDETGISKAEERGVSVAVELQKFTDYHKGKGSVMADWQAAWRTWLGNVKQGQETFKERDARNARKRWEEMTGNHSDTVLPDILRLS